MKYYVYILQTVDNTLYCGIALNIKKRFEEHIKGKGAKYTKSHKPEKIVYADVFEDKSQASKEEYRIKQLKKPQKLALIQQNAQKSEKILKNF